MVSTSSCDDVENIMFHSLAKLISSHLNLPDINLWRGNGNTLGLSMIKEGQFTYDPTVVQLRAPCDHLLMVGPNLTPYPSVKYKINIAIKNACTQ